MQHKGTTLETLKLAGSHYDIGYKIGAHFRRKIAQTIQANGTLQDTILPYHRSRAGQQRYANLLALHRERYPGYVAELEGMAEGSRLPFATLFLVNLRGEYRQYAVVRDEFGCSTCSVMTEQVAAFGHNEDGAAYFQQAMYLVEIAVTGQKSFTALCYPGFLPGNAFGFNAAGICHSVNNVRPHDIRNGIGRHFLARSIFEADTIEEAIAAVTVADRASGFNYTIGSINERRLVDVEVGPEDAVTIEINGQYFHANHYRALGTTDQTIMPSSWLRVEQGDKILSTRPLRKPADILGVLRDRKVVDYPILRDGCGPDDLATLVTALFDLDQRTLQIYSASGAFELIRTLPI